jgi:hypothetical protein
VIVAAFVVPCAEDNSLCSQFVDGAIVPVIRFLINQERNAPWEVRPALLLAESEVLKSAGIFTPANDLHVCPIAHLAPPFLPTPLDDCLSDGCLYVKLAFPFRFRYLVSTLKGFRDVAATLALETLQIQGAVAFFVDLDRDRFL